MAKQVNAILIPIDFSENAEVAISKAMEFCPDGKDIIIHLYHVQRIVGNGFYSLWNRLFSGYSMQQVHSDIEQSRQQLDALAKKIERERTGVKILTWVSFGEPVQESIIKKALQLGVDLIIIGKHAHHHVLPVLNTVMPVGLAAATGLPVFTCRPGSLYQQLKTVVVPVGTCFPHSKLDMINALKHKPRLHVRLVVFEGDDSGTTNSKELLLQTFRVFKSRFPNPVHYEILRKGNKAKNLLRYCVSVGADVLIVHPGEETRIGTWSNSQIADHIPADSKMQVLAIC